MMLDIESPQPKLRYCCALPPGRGSAALMMILKEMPVGLYPPTGQMKDERMIWVLLLEYCCALPPGQGSAASMMMLKEMLVGLYPPTGQLIVYR